MLELDDLVTFDASPASGGAEFVRAQVRDRPGVRYVIHRRAPTSRSDGAAAVQRCRRVVEGRRLRCMLRFVATIGPVDDPTCVYEDAPIGPPPRLGAARLEDVLRATIDVVDALAEVHAAGLVYHGLRAGCVAFTPGGAVLLDFAQAAPPRLAGDDVGESWQAAGDLRHVSPERVGRVDRGVDHRSDFYSLGVLLYEMLVGEPPFAADDPLELVHAHLTRAPPSPHARDPTIPRFVSDVARKLLAKDPAGRYQSTDGIHADLALALALALGEVASPDAVGSLDLPYDLHPSHLLYGRTSERSMLLSAFARVRAGSREVVQVSGPAGIGKTALVCEVFTALPPGRACFVAGKFDAIERRAPYSAWLTALEGLVAALLAEPEERVEAWRRRLDSALGARAGAVMEVLPGLAALLGSRQAGAPLPSHETQEWLIEGFCGLIAAASAVERPLVVFLDDLQWADAASLRLLERVLADPRCSSVLVIAAMREQEMTPTHPVRLTLERMEAAGALTVTRLAVSALGREELTQLVADTFRVAPAEVEPLASVIATKSGGNPFYAWQFLRLLRGTGLVRLELRQLRWTWDIARISAQELAENMVELMLHRLRALPPETCAALSWAACLGGRFEVAALAAALTEEGRPPVDIDELLAPALREELLVRVEGEGAARVLRFSHDRVQEEAYRLLDGEQLAAAHRRIARVLIDGRSPAERAERVFEIADHLNRATAPPTSDEERLEHARFNLVAARRAGEAAAFEAALAYATAGMSRLPADAWAREPTLTRELYATRGEFEYLAGDPAAAEWSVREAIAREVDPIARADLHRILVSQYTLRADYPAAIAAGRAGLGLLGVALAEEALDTDLADELARVDALLEGRSPGILVERPPMTDPLWLAAMRLLIALGPPCYRSHPRLWSLLVATEVRLCLEHGRAPGLTYAMPAFGGLEMHLGRGTARRCAELHAATIVLIADGVRPTDASVGHLMRGSSLSHWFAPLARASAAYEEAFTCGVDSGNLQYAAYAAAHDAYCRFYAGMPLDRLAARLETAWEFCVRRRNVWGMDLIEGARRVVAALRVEAAEPDFSRPDRPESDYLTACADHGDAQVLGIYHLMKAEALTHAGRFERAAAELSLARTFVPMVAVQGLLPATQHTFLRALLLLAAPAGLGVSRDEGLVQARGLLADLERWAAGCPENFEHMAALIAAEIAAAEGRDIAAVLDAFERAIDAAERQGMPHRVGLAGARAGAWWRSRGLSHYAAACDARSRAAYRQWRGDPGEGSPRGAGEGRAHLRPELDMRDVMRIAEAVAASTELHAVVHAVVDSVARVSAAQRTVLLLSNHLGDLRVWDSARGSEATREAVTLEALDELPRTVLQYVRRTREPARFDGRRPLSAADDPYLKATRPASALCVPLLIAGELQGLLYLEHREIFDAFDASRLDLVHFLAGAAAAAVRNAELVGELRADIARREDTERRLAESEREQRLLIERSPLAIDVYSAEGRLLRTNRAGAALSGADASPADLRALPPFVGAPEVLRRVLAGESLDLGEHGSADGERWLRSRTYGITGPSGELERIVLMQEDITERRRVERLKAEFVTTVSHELRTPVTSIVGTLGLLVGGVAGGLPPLALELLRIAAANSQRLGQLIDDVVDLERSERGDLSLRVEEIALAELLRRTIEGHRERAQERGVALTIELDDAAAATRLTIDGARFVQVLALLLSNAVKFSPSGSTVTLRGLCTAARIRVEVRDAGAGVPAAFRPRLFDRFAQADASDTRAHGGMGLGLSLARALVLRLGGAIGYEPCEPLGSCFFVELPRS